MWRYLAGAVAALLLVGAGVVLFRGNSPTSRSFAALPSAPPQSATGQDEPLPDSVPEATERTREQKRFDRYDKDRDGKVTREEYLMQRHKAFAKLDTNHDGRLSFDEWSIKNETKFATADDDKSGALDAKEFATTAVKRRPHAQVKCPPAEAAPAAEES